MTDSTRMAALLASLIMPLLGLAVAVGSTVLLVALTALALVALFVVGLAIGREQTQRK